MDNLKKLKQKLRDGKPVVGIFVTFADMSISELAGYAGCDFVWIDAEHAPIGRREIYGHVMAAQSAGACAFIRVPGVDPTRMKTILDMGPDGVIFPFIDSREKAELAVKACTYPPCGMRGQGPIRAIKYGLDDEAAYIEQAYSKVWKIMQIENMEGYQQIDEIMAVDGIDSFFIGQADLGRSIDLPPDQKPQRLNEVTDDLCARLRAGGKLVGTVSGSTPADIERDRKRGICWHTIGQDARLMSLPLAGSIREINAAY